MKTVKLFVILISIVVMIIGLSNYTYAGDTLGDIIQDGKEFTEKAQGTAIDDTDIKKFSDIVYNVVLSIGMIIAVIVGSILGIQYMYSSVEERAKSKQNLVVYFIGCVVLLGAFGIWKIVIEIFNTI